MTLRRFELAVLSLLLACGSDDSTSEPSGVVARYLDTYNSEVEVTCPCRVSEGSFSSEEECHRKLVISASTERCLSAQFEMADSEGLRASLGCMAELSVARTECIGGSMCEKTKMNACFDTMMECPMLDPQLLTRVFNACPDSILLGR
jgi:hypothetical protein